MSISYSLGSLLSIDDILKCADILRGRRADTVWIPETWGMENFAMLGAVSQKTPSKIGSSIINIYSRSPALIAMGAVTVDTISRGRMVLGLGTSSPPIVEDFHGYDFERPAQRMREYIGIIKAACAGEKIEHSGKFFDLKGFRLLIRPFREKIPIYVAAVNPKMVQTAWEMGDGVIFYLRPLSELSQTISRMQQKKRIDAACQIITAVSQDSQAALDRAKATIAFYVSVGRIYREFLAKNGFASETRNIFEEHQKSGPESAAQMVPDSMAKNLAIFGTPDECKKQLGRFVDAGVTQPIIQFNPVGETIESFRLVASTFSEDSS